MAQIYDFDSRFITYTRDESRHEGSFEKIAFPASTDDLADTIKAFAETGTAFTVQGARTGISGAGAGAHTHVRTGNGAGAGCAAAGVSACISACISACAAAGRVKGDICIYHISGVSAIAYLIPAAGRAEDSYCSALVKSVPQMTGMFVNERRVQPRI